MTGVLKKGLVLLVVVFIGFYMFNDPNGLAQTTKDASAGLWDGLTNLFGAMIDFLDAIKS
ncbi:MAG: hypothetical protein J7518_00550 [Nocardioidaceae bacterium]|nr:hypothetical protein [Nocardioidaceae bacterium]